MRVQGVQGQECPQHESTQPGPLTLLPHKTRVRHKKQAQVQTVGVESLGRGGKSPDPRGSRKNQKKAPELYGQATTQQHPGFCAGGSSKTNGSGYPLSVPAVAHPPPAISRW